MSIHLVVHRRLHRLVTKGDIEVHAIIKGEGLLIVGTWDFVWLLEVTLLQSSHCSHFLEQVASHYCNIGSNINNPIHGDTLDLDSDALWPATLVLDSDLSDGPILF